MRVVCLFLVWSGLVWFYLVWFGSFVLFCFALLRVFLLLYYSRVPLKKQGFAKSNVVCFCPSRETVYVCVTCSFTKKGVAGFFFECMVLCLQAKPGNRKSLQYVQVSLCHARAYRIIHLALRFGHVFFSSSPDCVADACNRHLLSARIPFKSRKRFIGIKPKKGGREGAFGVVGRTSRSKNIVPPALSHSTRCVLVVLFVFFRFLPFFVAAAACRASTSACWKRRWLDACHPWVVPSPLLYRHRQ